MSSILGQAKTGVYVSRKQKVDDLAGVNVTLMFSQMVKSRIVTDFSYFEGVKDEFRVSSGDVLCLVRGNQLTFSVESM